MTTYGQVFGLPVVITVPRKGCTYRTLYDAIISQIGRFVIKSEETTKPEEDSKNTKESEEGEKGDEAKESEVKEEDDKEKEQSKTEGIV